MTEGDALADGEIVERFAGVTMWRANGQRAPHKPPLILRALAAVQQRAEVREEPGRNFTFFRGSWIIVA